MQSTSRICNFEWYFIIILFYRKFHCISCNFPKLSSTITSRLDNIIIYNKTTTGWHLIFHIYIKLYNILKINKTKIYLETIFYVIFYCKSIFDIHFNQPFNSTKCFLDSHFDISLQFNGWKKLTSILYCQRKTVYGLSNLIKTTCCDYYSRT